MPAKRILLVDDQRDVTRLLRSALETLGQDYVIVETPSGEEALLEIGRGGADLLVIDVRLPGISGLDVVKRLRRTNASQAQVIVISGVSNPQMETEALNLGALAFLKKPISVDSFLPLAQRALGDQAAQPEVTLETEQPAIADRLSTLRRDLGANAVFLVDMQGRVTVRAGDVTRIDIDPVMAQVISAMGAALKVSGMLGGLIPSNVLFFDGDEFDVYAANVGQYYAIVMIYDGERGAGQMGPVMRYGRQCADDLLNSLVMLGVKMDVPTAVSFAPRPSAVPMTIPPVTAAPRPAPAKPAPAPVVAKPSPAAAPAPAKPAPAPAAPAPAKPLTEAELKALDEALNKLKAQDANSFWDSLTEETEAADLRPDAISLEDAEKLGLVEKK
jgi:CheY-like chemotaxis protein